MRIVYFGMTGLFSIAPLKQLIGTGMEIVAVVIPQYHRLAPVLVKPQPPGPSDLPLLSSYLQENIVHVAWQHQIPVWEVGKLTESATIDQIAQFRSDLICVVCFPYIFPKVLLELPQYGCINLHPSLLPAYRGAMPIQQIIQHGERRSGVTLHFMDEGIDTGEIISQVAFDLPAGITEIELTQRCAIAGATLLVETVENL
jgi:methionyl-tRNA formyltransferase